MDALLVKIFATALTFSQVVTAPDTLKTNFDPDKDRQQVTELLRAGCEHVRRAFDLESINLDDLIATAMEDPKAVTGERVEFRGIDLNDLQTAYRQFCNNETVANSPIDLGEVVQFYNRTLDDLPDIGRLAERQSGASLVLDAKGNRLAEIFPQGQRRISVSLADIPEHVQKAFIAAEDKRFYEHHGVDERAVIRAFLENLSQSGRPQGGSTITQQVVKNLLVGDEVSYERKIREMVLASRLEQTLTKAQILEIYLNSIFLGRASWGVEMAARNYFGKSASALTIGEGALLAALTKGPSYLNPETHADRAKERLGYVLRRMQEDGAISAGDAKAAAALPAIVRYQPPQQGGSYFTDYVAREIRADDDLSGLGGGSTTVHSTLDPDLQRAAETALQEGLARYEQAERRVDFRGPETNLAAEVDRLRAGPPRAKPAWQQALQSARLSLSDVHWDAAVVIGTADGRRRGGSLTVGLADGTVLPLSGPVAILHALKPYDVVLVRVAQRGRKGRGAVAELRVRPAVQGAVVALENRTGRILAMVGGFSYAASQLNRVTQSQRQPGSALKPLTYLAALQKGLQPNTLVRDEEITFAPMVRSRREEDYWTPRNYDGNSFGVITLRQALENSRNQATASLLRGGIEEKPEQSLDRICNLAVELQIYKDCIHFYPFVLGAQPVRPIDLASFFATIANEGERPPPYAIDTVEQNGNVVYRRQPSLMKPASVDAASFYQLKTMLQGVVQRGTARAISDLAPYVAGKTGTSEDENDAWFVGFTNDVTVAVWVGYDNGEGKRRTLGAGSTGAHTALPIFEPIIAATWAQGRPKTPLNPPSPQARRLLVAAEAEQTRHGRSHSAVLLEYFRKNSRGEPIDARYALLSRRGEGRTSRARSQSVGRSVWRWDQPADSARRNSNAATSRTFSNTPGTASEQPANPWGSWGSWGGNRTQPQQSWQSSPRSTPYSSGRSYPNGGFFGFPFGR